MINIRNGFLVAFGVIFFSCPLFADSITQDLIKEDVAISTKIRGWARDLDLYLANGEYAKDPNKTSVVLYNAVSFVEGGERTYTPRLGIKLHLPNLQKKWRVLVTNYDQDRESRGINRNRYRSPEREESYETSIGVLQQLGKMAVEFRPLVEYRDELYTSYLLIFSSKAESGAVTFSPELQLFARSDTGTGQFVGLNVTFQLDLDNTLTVINEEQYSAADNMFATNQGFKWNHTYNAKMLHQNTIIFESHKKTGVPYHLERYVLSSTFEHKIYPNVLHYEVTPLAIFARDVGFKAAYGLDLVLKIIF